MAGPLWTSASLAALRQRAMFRPTADGFPVSGDRGYERKVGIRGSNGRGRCELNQRKRSIPRQPAGPLGVSEQRAPTHGT